MKHDRIRLLRKKLPEFDISLEKDADIWWFDIKRGSFHPHWIFNDNIDKLKRRQINVIVKDIKQMYIIHLKIKDRKLLPLHLQD